MGLWKKLREMKERRLLKKMAREELARMEKQKLEDFAMPISPVLPAEGTTAQMGEVTGSYKTVSAMMREVIEEKKKGRSAAQRITAAVGVVPETSKKHV